MKSTTNRSQNNRRNAGVNKLSQKNAGVNKLSQKNANKRQQF